MLEQGSRSPLAGGRLMAFLATTRPVEAKRFFGETLELGLVTEDQFALVFEGAGVMLRVTPVEQLTPQPFTVLGWQVPDAASAVRALAARGVAVERFEGIDQDALGIWHAPSGAQVAWFKDPDGNVLSVSQH